MDEKTLAEARQILNERECDLHGHYFEHVVTAAGELTRIACGNCGAAWSCERI